MGGNRGLRVDWRASVSPVGTVRRYVGRARRPVVGLYRGEGAEAFPARIDGRRGRIVPDYLDECAPRDAYAFALPYAAISAVSEVVIFRDASYSATARSPRKRPAPLRDSATRVRGSAGRCKGRLDRRGVPSQ